MGSSSTLTIGRNFHIIIPQSAVKEGYMVLAQISGVIGGVIAIIAGIIVLVKPQILAWVVGIFLIIFGIFAVLAAI
jgi:uncharacterized membrane protein HdeD (DUF308 family)